MRNFVTMDMTIDDMYGMDNLSIWPLFKGGYINFGIWDLRKLKKRMLLDEDRIDSSKKMYETIYKKLSPQQMDTIVEVGCGLGFGCVDLTNNYQTHQVIGLDASAEQIFRANELHKEWFFKNLKFVIGEAENLPFAPNSVNKIFSVEAIQHFSCPKSFIHSAYKILKKNGKAVFTTFFFKRQPNSEELDGLQTISNGIGKVFLISDFVSDMKAAGFKKIKCESIGSHVWAGFDKWMQQTEFSNSWNRNWLISFKNELVDYYIITATK